MLDFLQMCFFILTASEVGRVEIPEANKSVLLVVALFFPSLFYFPQVQSCPRHTVSWRSQCDSLCSLLSLRFLLRGSNQKLITVLSKCLISQKRKKKIMTENILQLQGRGEEQNTKTYKEKDLKASHLWTAPPVVKGQCWSALAVLCSGTVQPCWPEVALPRLLWGPFLSVWTEAANPGCDFGEKDFSDLLWVRVILFLKLWRVTSTCCSWQLWSHFLRV